MNALVSAVFGLVICWPTQSVAVTLHVEGLPANLNFTGNKMRILDREWFNFLFPRHQCALDLTPEMNDFSANVVVQSTSPKSLSFEIEGLGSSIIAQGHAQYVPIHYSKGQPVKPYLDVKIADFRLLRITFQTKHDVREVTLSVHTGGRRLILHPILTAQFSRLPDWSAFQ